MLNDYKCKKCGKIEQDIWTLKSSDIVLCTECNNEMDIQYTGFGVKTNSRTERKVPDNYKPSGGANFGKI